MTGRVLGQVGIEGKRLSGSRCETSTGVHPLHAFSTNLKAAAGSLAVPPDGGEAVEALELIKSLRWLQATRLSLTGRSWRRSKSVAALIFYS